MTGGYRATKAEGIDAENRCLLNFPVELSVRQGIGQPEIETL
jgi:hypothetical protein